MLLKGWLDFEKNFGDQASIKAIQAKMPRIIKKRRIIKTADGEEAGSQEYKEYIFPDEQNKQVSLAILENARKWKKQKMHSQE